MTKFRSSAQRASRTPTHLAASASIANYSTQLHKLVCALIFTAPMAVMKHDSPVRYTMPMVSSGKTIHRHRLFRRLSSITVNSVETRKNDARLPWTC